MPALGVAKEYPGAGLVFEDRRVKPVGSHLLYLTLEVDERRVDCAISPSDVFRSRLLDVRMLPADGGKMSGSQPRPNS
jgi:hypothetical protein